MALSAPRVDSGSKDTPGPIGTFLLPEVPIDAAFPLGPGSVVAKETLEA